MIFLYRFELLKLDGLLAERFPSDYTDAQIPGRQLFLHTNYEQAISFGSTEPFMAPFLPSGLSAPIEGWNFLPERIAHDGLSLDGEKGSGQLKVRIPLDHPIALRFSREDAGGNLWLTVATLQDEDDTAPLVVWVGRLQSCEFDEFRCELSLSHLKDTLNRVGLTRKHPRMCQHALYDASTCKVKAHAYDTGTSYFKFREDGIVSGIADDRLSLTVPEAANRPNGFFENGYLVIEPDYAVEAGVPLHLPRTGGLTSTQAAASLVNGGIRRSIVQHTGGTLALLTPILTQLPPSARITLYAGCSKQPDGTNGCSVKFVNFYNFGGYPFIPTKNPFESGLQ